jgi:uncharacterized transporter YbjL
MSLPSAQTLSNNILALAPSSITDVAIPLFVDVIANFTNEVQAGPDGTPGILTFGNAAMVTAMEAMVPVADSSWIPIFADAWEAGITTGIITPGTVTDPAWLGSGNKDTETLASPATTIITLSAAKAILISGLMSAMPDNTAPLAFATAIYNATLAFQFECIGLGVAPTFIPIPIVFPAQ